MMHCRIAALLFVAGFAAGAVLPGRASTGRKPLPAPGALPWPAGRATARHHLYVAALLYVGSETGLVRFPIIDGKPAQQPDLVYTAASGPITIGPDGSLYAVDNQAFLTVDRFAPGSTSPESSLLVEPCGASYIYNGIGAILTDANGYLYTSVNGGVSGLLPEGAGRCGGDTIAIYPPNATGHTRPVRKIPVELAASQPPVLGLALDHSGDLGLTRWQDNVVRVYANPINAPKLIRLFWGPQLSGPEGIVFDPAANDVYLGNRIPPSVAVLPADANGGTRAKRIIRNPNAQHFCGQIALFGRYVFVSDTQTDTVYEYDKDARGTPAAIATVTVPFASCGVAVD